MASGDKTPTERSAEAMRSVYGPFEDLSPEQAREWTPPDDPGAGGHKGRYLWTDAFGVINFLTLYKDSSNPAHLELAKSLVRTVHDVLGRTRDGTSRLPGATDENPLKGGLRIGKLDAEGSDGDGQYHHYLTLWMFALNRLAVVSGEERYNTQAIQLAKAIHPAFVYTSCSRRLSLVWKVSTDLRRVLVGSEGHLDAATGYVVFRLLRRTAHEFNPALRNNTNLLTREIDEYRGILHREGGRGLKPSMDTLDLGMGLWMAHLARDEEWARELGEESLVLAHRVVNPERGIVARSAARRLAFREFGFCLGVKCYGADRVLMGEVDRLVGFWEEYSDSYHEDGDLRPISLVMYAAAIKPGVFYDASTEQNGRAH